MAESRMYLPLAAVVALVISGGFVLGRNLLPTRQQTRRILEWGASGILVVVLTIMTIQRNRDYGSALSIWQDTVVKCPNNARAHYNLGFALWEAGRPQEAIRHYEQAVRIKPDLFMAQNNLGFALSATGRIQEAIRHFEQALRLKPDSVEAHNNLGFALLQVDKPQEAIGHFEQALRIQPDCAEAFYNWGHALEQLGRLPEAIKHYQQALRIRPDYVEAHNDLGNALLREGNVRDALGQFEQALRIKPDAASVQNNLAWLLAMHAPAEGGDPDRAVTLAERACELTDSQVPAYLDTLAAAYAAAGRFNDAIASAQKAIELARSAGQQQAVSEIEAHLQLYRDGRAYRQPIHATSPPNQ